MVCETQKPAYPYISNDKSTTSTENTGAQKWSQFVWMSENKFFIGKQTIVTWIIFQFQTTKIFDCNTF